MALTVDEIVAHFPNKKLPQIHGEPTYETINDMVQHMYANAATIATPLGGGQHGHIGLIMKQALYQTLSETPFIAPPDPGPLPVYNPNIRYTGADREAVATAHKETRRIFDTYTNVDHALKKQIIEAVDDIYLEEQRNRYTGYLAVTSKDLITHLLRRYGKISPGDLNRCNQRMTEPMDPSLPIDMFFKRIDGCIELAADAENPFSEKQILQAAFYAISSSGLYTEACKTWKKRGENTKTWKSFKVFFASEYHDLKEQNEFTATSAGFHSANAVYPQETHQATITDALDHLAMATSNDRTIIEALTASNAKLTATNEKLAADLQQAITLLQQLVTSDEQREQLRCQKVSEYNMKFAVDGYCWSHGYKVTPNHTSKTCSARKPGHKEAATRANTMGGSQLNKGWKHPSQL